MDNDKLARKRLPSKGKIASHWDARIEEFGVFVPMQETLDADTCWACGRIGQIQRCHIVDYLDGGPNTADNLVLLCAGCHSDSESFSPPAFWNWMRHSREHLWVDGITRVMNKMQAAGYGQEKVAQMIAENGTDTTTDIIGADMYGRQFISSREKVS